MNSDREFEKKILCEMIDESRELKEPKSWQSSELVFDRGAEKNCTDTKDYAHFDVNLGKRKKGD